MYKKQLRFQNIVCLFAVVMAAVYFIYSLGILTDIHDALKIGVRNIEKPERDRFDGCRLFYDMQPFNKQFNTYSVYLILVSCLLFVMNTHSRRKYYIGNYVAIGAYSAGAIALTVWSHGQIEHFKHLFLTTVDFEGMAEVAETFDTLYLDNTNMLDLHYTVGALTILSVVLLIVNAVWKIALMNNEKALIKEGEEASV